MGVNFPASGSSGMEKVPAPEAVTTRVEGSVSQTKVPVTTSELRKAELKGEKYSISDEQLVKEIEQAIKAVQGKITTLEFSIHEKTNLVAVKVLDKDTGEVIREIPPEKSLDFVAKLWEMAGIFVDERR